MATFTLFTEAQFKSWADETFGEGDYVFTFPKNGRELVIRMDTGVEGLEVHIYTSLTREEGVTRAKGEDAIRCVLYDRTAGKIVYTAKKILRTEGATSIWQRLNERMDELFDIVDKMDAGNRFCKKCGSHTVERTNKRTGEPFYGCGAFPNCGDRALAKQRYPLQFDAWGMGNGNGHAANGQQQQQQQQPIRDEVTLVHEATTGDQVHGAAAGVLPIVDEDKVTATAEYPYTNYPFTHFNRVQSAVFQNNLWNTDCNVVLGTTTSSGKTIAAELAMGETLAQGKKVLYVSPLKSLTQEKFDEWQVKYVQYRIEILTGDYVLSPSRAEDLLKADIICLTSEMVDSRTRNYQSEKSQWMYGVGLVVVDESHIISTGRGHAVEAGIMRFAKLVPQAKLWVLSATMPNVEDFRTWLKVLNGKNTEVINSDWRPVELEWHFVPHLQMGTYWEVQDSKRELAAEIVMSKPEEKFLVFVHDKVMGRRIVGDLAELNQPALFHNADLGLQDRLEIERRFADRNDTGVRVLVSTSTLAWGRTLPARNVVIVGTTRGIQDVDELDFIQMAGRAGRFGVDPKGDVYFICDSPAKWATIVKNPRAVTSTLIDENILGFHILAEVKNKEIWNWETLNKWFDRTLARIQKPVDEDIVTKVVCQLQNWGMLVIDERGVFNITRLGRVSATLYFLPQDVHHWARYFNDVDQRGLWESDLALSYALGTTPSHMMDYVPKSEIERVRDYTEAVYKVWPTRLEQSVVAADLHELMQERGSTPTVRTLQNDIERIVQALVWIAGIKNWRVPALWKALPIRIKYGVKGDLVELCLLPGIGGTRARKLYKAGIKDLDGLLKSPRKVQQLLGQKVTEKALAAAKAQVRLRDLEQDPGDHSYMDE